MKCEHITSILFHLGLLGAHGSNNLHVMEREFNGRERKPVNPSTRFSQTKFNHLETILFTKF